MKLSKKQFGEVTAYYRAGVGEPSSDEQALEEVLVKKAYRRIRSGFDVMPGEQWIDLGANIGSFAMYCASRGAAMVSCFEPEPECFKILMKNIEANRKLAEKKSGLSSSRGRLSLYNAYNTAVTAQRGDIIHFKKSANPQNHYRGTTLSNAPGNYIECPPVKNLYAGKLLEMFPGGVDGIKMDIEGSEARILDEWLLPITTKLVLEYHTSRDSDVGNLADRLEEIREHFNYVKYPKVFDDVIKRGDDHYRPRFDSLIFAWGRKLS